MEYPGLCNISRKINEQFHQSRNYSRRELHRRRCFNPLNVQAGSISLFEEHFINDQRNKILMLCAMAKLLY